MKNTEKDIEGNKIISDYESGKFKNLSKYLKGAKYPELD